MCSLESLTASGTITYPMLVMSNAFFVSLDYHLLAFSYWQTSALTHAPIGPS